MDVGSVWERMLRLERSDLMWGRNKGAAETVYPAKSVTRRLRKGIKINDIMASRVLISLLQEGDRPFYSETWEPGVGKNSRRRWMPKGKTIAEVEAEND